MEFKCPRCGAEGGWPPYTCGQCGAVIVACVHCHGRGVRVQQYPLARPVGPARVTVEEVATRFPPRFDPALHPEGTRVRVDVTGREYISTGVCWREERSAER